MSVITLPANVHFEKIPVLSLLRSGLSIRSKYTGKRQHINFPFAMWALQGTLVPKQGTDAGVWRSFVVQLEGQKNTFRLPIPGYSGPQNGYSGNGAVKSAVLSRAKSFTMKGLTPGAPVFTDGDYFVINDECKMVTGNLAADGSGELIVTFEPAMRKPASADDVVTLQDPWIYVSSVDNDSGSWALDHPVEHTFKLNTMEVID